GDQPMAAMVVVFNRLVWRRLYALASTRFKTGDLTCPEQPPREPAPPALLPDGQFFRRLAGHVPQARTLGRNRPRAVAQPLLIGKIHRFGKCGTALRIPENIIASLRIDSWTP